MLDRSRIFRRQASASSAQPERRRSYPLQNEQQILPQRLPVCEGICGSELLGRGVVHAYVESGKLVVKPTCYERQRYQYYQSAAAVSQQRVVRAVNPNYELILRRHQQNTRRRQLTDSELWMLIRGDFE